MTNNPDTNEKLQESVLYALSILHDQQKIGQEQLRSIVINNQEDEKRFNIILSAISDKLATTKRDERREFIRIFSILTKNRMITQNLPSIIILWQTFITEENTKYFNIISETFGDMVNSSWKLVMIDKDKKLVYESFVGFCLSNMKSENKWSQVSGTQCLSRLIESCPLVLASSNMKSIWENICFFLDKFSFSAKSELLDALISLIFAAEGFFKPFATLTLYKILDFLTDSEWVKRKLAIDIIYTLGNYCQEEIFPLKLQITEFLIVLKDDKIKQVREACLVTLNFLLEGNDSKYNDDKNKINKSLEKSPLDTVNTKIKDNKNFDSVNNKSFSNNYNILVLSQDKKSQNIRDSSEKKSTTITTDSNNPSICLNNSNISPLKTNEIKKRDNTIVYNSENKKKRDVSKLKEEKLTINNTNFGKKSITQIKSKNDPIVTDLKSTINKDEKTRIRTTLKRSNKNEKITPSLSPIKKETVSSIFKGPKNKDFFNNAPTDNGIQIVIENKKHKTNTIHSENCEEINLEEAKTDNKLINQKISKEMSKNNYNSNQEFCKELSSIDKDKNINILLKSQNRFEEPTSSPKFSHTNSEDPITITENKVLKNEQQSTHSNIIYPPQGISNHYEAYQRNNENSEILKQMKDMSEKQIILLETLERLQKSSNDQMNSITNRLSILENVVYNALLTKKSSNRIFSASNSAQNLNNFNLDNQTISSFSEKKNYDSPTSLRNQDQIYNFTPQDENKNFFVGSSNNDENAWTELITHFKNNKIKEALDIAYTRDNKFLIKFIENINFYQLKHLKLSILEELISRLLNIIAKMDYVSEITHFLKNLTLIYNFELKFNVLRNIKDTLDDLIKKDSFREDDANVINVITCFINNKIHNQANQGEIIQNFEQDNNSNYIYVKSNRISKK